MAASLVRRLKAAWLAIAKGKIVAVYNVPPVIVRLEVPEPCSKCASMIELEAISYAAYEGANKALQDRLKEVSEIQEAPV